MKNAFRSLAFSLLLGMCLMVTGCSNQGQPNDVSSINTTAQFQSNIDLVPLENSLVLADNMETQFETIMVEESTIDEEIDDLASLDF